MRAGLHIDLLPERTHGLDLTKTGLTGKVNHDHGDIGKACHLEQAADRLCLENRRTALRVRGGGKLTGSLLFGDQCVDYARVFAVHARDAAQLPQLLQREEDVSVADHHGGIGQVHFERADALLKHLRKLRDVFLRPVVDRHMEAIVARRAAVCFLVPQIQTKLQRLALVRAGEVDDHRRAAAQRGAPAGVEVVRCRCVADVQIKMCVRVNETGEEELPADINDLRVVAFDIRRDLHDRLVGDQNVCPLSAGGIDDDTALK